MNYFGSTEDNPSLGTQSMYMTMMMMIRASNDIQPNLDAAHIVPFPLKKLGNQ